MVKDDNKQKLIKATDALLKDRSISSITTKEITKAAGVSVGVFYNYFRFCPEYGIKLFWLRLDETPFRSQVKWCFK